MPELIVTKHALDAALPVLRNSPSLALDTETDAFFAYRPKVCLLQVSVPGHDYLLDPLQDFDLSAFGELLGDPRQEVVLHAAENDVIHIHHQFGWRIANLFDTQVACFVLGLKPYSLAGVLESRFGVKLDKRMQRSNWSARPLSEEQVRYAAEDTEHLLALAEDLHARAREAGREEEIATECARIATRDWTPEPFDPEGFRRMAGARELDPVRLRVLRDLYLYRNREAERRNRAPYRVVSDSILFQIARDRLTHPRKGIPRTFWERYGDRVAGIVRRALERGPLGRPPRRKPSGEPLSAAVKRRYEALRRWRGKAAAERGVEAFVVARNELLLQVARKDPRTPEDLAEVLEPFRMREYGSLILDVLGGTS